MHNQKLYMPVLLQYVYICDDINIFCLSCTPGLTSIVVNQSSKFFKNSCFSHENQGSSVDKNGASKSFNSHAKAVVLLTFIAYIEKFIHNFTKYHCFK